MKASKPCANFLVIIPGPRLMRIHIVRNSTIAKFQKSPNIHLVRLIIHLVQILAQVTRKQ